MSRSYFGRYERRQYTNKTVRRVASRRIRRMKVILPDGNYYRKISGDTCGQDVYHEVATRGDSVKKYPDGKRLDNKSLKKFRFRRASKQQILVNMDDDL